MTSATTKKTRQFFFIAIAMFYLNIHISFAQKWQIGGNNNTNTLPFPDRVSPTSIFGITEPGYPLNIYAGGLTQRAIISGNGNFGIGNAFLFPANLLDVRGTTIGTGDINIGNGTPASPQSYMIGDNRVLWHNGITSNPLVRVSTNQ